MAVFHSTAAQTIAPIAALERLEAAISQVRGQHEGNFERLERELHALFVTAERELLGEELERLDIDVPSVLVEGEVHHRVLRGTETYTSAAGPVTVTRSLYRSGKSSAVVPMELRAGMVAGHWTPLAARQALWVVTHLTPGEGEGLFRELGNMRPSKSSLDRLPKRLGESWEAQREAFEADLRAQLEVPDEAVTVSVSLDGVMAPMKDGERQAVRASQRADGKRTKGPAGYREVGCATLSFHDAEGERLSTVRMARMPESKKATLKSMLSAELDGVVTRHPELTLVKLADGAKDNWTYLHGIFPEAEEVVDYFHAVSHLKKAFDAAYGENTTQALGQFKKYRHILRDDANGVEKVIRALVYLRKHHPRRKAIATELGYFRGHRHRMRYAQMTARDPPIGSGIVEAACKTLVTQRMKRSGMRWRHEGGQAILTFRSLIQSGRFNAAWGLVSQTYTKTVVPPDNIVVFPVRRLHWPVSSRPTPNLFVAQVARQCLADAHLRGCHSLCCGRILISYRTIFFKFLAKPGNPAPQHFELYVELPGFLRPRGHDVGKIGLAGVGGLYFFLQGPGLGNTLLVQGHQERFGPRLVVTSGAYRIQPNFQGLEVLKGPLELLAQTIPLALPPLHGAH